MCFATPSAKRNATNVKNWKNNLIGLKMKFRLIKSAATFYPFPAISIVYDSSWYGHYEIAFVWLKWYFCLEFKI